MDKLNCYACIVSDCKNKVHNNVSQISFFLVPKSGTKRKLWLQNVKREDLLDAKFDNKKLRVCEDHFDCIVYKKSLPTDALPKFIFKVEHPRTLSCEFVSKENAATQTIHDKYSWCNPEISERVAEAELFRCIKNRYGHKVATQFETMINANKPPSQRRYTEKTVRQAFKIHKMTGDATYELLRSEIGLPALRTIKLLNRKYRRQLMQPSQTVGNDHSYIGTTQTAEKRPQLNIMDYIDTSDSS